MSSSINSSQYYQLNNPSQTTASSLTTPSLANALEGDTSSSTSSDEAYMLNLSPQAQQYLSGINSISGASSASGSSLGDSFTLSSAQEQTLENILLKYKDSPENQDTFDQIQNDMNAAGIGTTQLSAVDQAQSFDPTSILVDALNGQYTDPSQQASNSAATEQAKSSNYMQSVISEWHNLAGNSASSSSASASATTTPATGGTA